MRQADIHDSGQSNIPARDKQPTYGGYPRSENSGQQDQNATPGPSHLGGLIMISATDGSVTTRAITLIRAIGTLDHCLGKEEVAREMVLVTLMMMVHQIACTKIVRAPP